MGRSRTVSRDRKEKAGDGFRRDVIPSLGCTSRKHEAIHIKNFQGEESWTHKRVLPLQTALSLTHPGNSGCPESPSFPNPYYVLETWNDSLHIPALLRLATPQEDEGSYLQMNL